MNILGISGVLGHDAAACLMIDGRLVTFIEEERLSRQKHAPGDFPLRSTAWCLHAAGIDARDIDVLAASWDPALAPTMPLLGDWVPRFLAHPVWRRHQPRIVYVPHHQAHAVSGAYMHGVDEAAVLVIDGNGEHTATTIAKLTPDRFDVLEEYPIASSLGHFYKRAAFHLGLGQHGEGRLMGLAGYGQPVRAIDPLAAATDGTYEVTLDLPAVSSPLQHLRSLATAWDAWFERAFGAPEPVHWTWDSDTWSVHAEAPGARMRADVAASVQHATEQIVVGLAHRATRITGNRHLILSGGVALNGGANAAILDRGAADSLVFFPGVHDAGGALGAAAWAARIEGDRWQPGTMGPYSGPIVTATDAMEVSRQSGLCWTRVDNAPAEAARRIARGRIVAWCRGGMEAGPRALGNRSILARADRPEVAERANAIKQREGWRPFGPSIRIEDTGTFFSRATTSPYMLEFRAVRPEAREALAAVVHVDGTTRPQTVSQSGNPAFHALITAVGELTGIPAVINTSFNVGPEPIVCSPWDAIRTFVGSQLDDLFVDDVLISRDS